MFFFRNVSISKTVIATIDTYMYFYKYNIHSYYPPSPGETSAYKGIIPLESL